MPLTLIKENINRGTSGAKKALSLGPGGFESCPEGIRVAAREL